MQLFEGIWLPLITPFHNGELDLTAARRLVNYYIDAGIHGFVVCGTTGEAATLDEIEQLALLDVVLETAAGRRPVVMGLASNDTREALRMLRPIQRRPVAGLLTVAPYYSRPSQGGIEAHFRAIAAETPLPLILYNIPYRTGVNIDLATVQSLADVPTIVAIKESGGNMNQLMDLIRETRLQVLSGEDHLIFTTLCLGGTGAIAAAAHLHPDQHVRVYESFRAGNFALARELAAKLLPITRALFSEANPGPIKALLAHQGHIVEELRLPMIQVSATLRDSLIRDFAVGMSH
jgi:4-hydroxy-tetrahydrodipicolinate synthase